MNVNQAVDNIQRRLDTDPTSPQRYTDAVVLSALNSANEDVVSRAVPGLLTALQVSTRKTITTSGIVLTALHSDYYRYVASRQYAIGSGKLIIKKDIEDIHAIDNDYLSYSNADPVCYIWGSTYYLLVDTYANDYNKAEIYILIKPDTLVAGMEFQIHSVLMPSLLKLAEAELRATYKFGTSEEIAYMYETAHKDIEAINKAYKQGVYST